MPFDYILRSDLNFGEKFGSGGFRVICKALWISKNITIACKCIGVTITGNSNIKLKLNVVSEELAACVKCHGPDIIPKYGISVEFLSSTNLRLIIPMEYMPQGSLMNLLRQEYHQLTFREKIIIACNIVSGMTHIHEHGMIHRGLRPGNILIDNHYRARIGDMGISQSYNHTYGNPTTLIDCVCDMPPEFYQYIFNGKFDIYTFGLILNHLFTGRSSF